MITCLVFPRWNGKLQEVRGWYLCGPTQHTHTSYIARTSSEQLITNNTTWMQQLSQIEIYVHHTGIRLETGHLGLMQQHLYKCPGVPGSYFCSTLYPYSCKVVASVSGRPAVFLGGQWFCQKSRDIETNTSKPATPPFYFMIWTPVTWPMLLAREQCGVRDEGAVNYFTDHSDILKDTGLCQ